MKKKSTCEGDIHQLKVLVLIVFLISLTVLSVVVIINQIKQSKYIGQDVVQRSTINVAGVGEVLAKPDLATISFSVITEGETTDGATEENTEKMNAIIEVVKAQGVEDKDIKTTNYSVYPRYDYDDEKYFYGDDDRELVGYEVYQTLQVKIRNVDDAGEIIQVATQAGANQVGGLNFIIDDEDSLKAEARELAIKDAKDKAKLLANQLGVKLVRIMYFSENTYPYYDYARSEMSMDVGMGGAVPAPKIEPGEGTVTVNVNITYEIN